MSEALLLLVMLGAIGVMALTRRIRVHAGILLFQRQRSLLTEAVNAGELDDEYAQIVMQRVDLRQSAAGTIESER